MTRRYNLSLHITDSEDNQLVDLYVGKKTLDTINHLIRLSMPDFEHVEPTPPQTKKRKLFGKPKRVDPPIEPMTEPTPEDIENI